MALIECPKCDGVVSTKAVACPHCAATAEDIVAGKPTSPDMERVALADELGSISAAIAYEYDRPEAAPPRELQTLEIDDAGITKTEVLQTSQCANRVFVTNTKGIFDKVVLSILWAIAITMVVLFFYFKVSNYGSKQKAAEEAKRTWEELNESVRILHEYQEKANQKPVFGTRSEDFELNKFTQPSKPPEMLKRPPEKLQILELGR